MACVLCNGGSMKTEEAGRAACLFCFHTPTIAENTSHCAARISRDIY